MLTRSEAEALDAADPLAPLRAEFRLPEDVVYLDGNSLGALPAATPGRLDEVLWTEWGHDLITSWNRHGWIELPLRIGERIASLVGAAPGQVVVADSISVNLFKLLAAAVEARPGRGVVLAVDGEFPTDLYVAEGLCRLLGGRAELRSVRPEALAGSLDQRVAVVTLSHVDFRSGEVRDMAGLTEHAHHAGALVLWDLAHSAGVLEVELDRCAVDLAVGCGYKYLCGGPGAPAFLYVAGRHQELLANPLSGWMGHAEPFRFEPAYRPASGVARFLSGTPPILSLAALEVGVETVARAGPSALAAKARALTSAFVALVDHVPLELGLRLASPREPARRGGQVTLAHEHGYAVVQALIARGVIGDFREPGLIRFGFAPLTTRFVDVWDAATLLEEVLVTRSWDRPEHRRRARVT